MEDSAVKEQASALGKSASRLLRYPLRSATKIKEEKPQTIDSSNSASAAKRGRASSSVSKSVGVLDLSAKEKSAKPPRRLSVASKSSASSAPKSFGNTTPISEVRAKSTSGNQGKSDTPASDISKSSSRKKFSVLSSASYWLTQIKLSESAAKHSISLGFFKLALEAKCEPMQRMSDELKSYVRRYDLSDLGELTKELFESYKINTERSKFTGAYSQVPAEGNKLPDDDVRSSSSSITDAEKLKPKCLDIGTGEGQQVKIATSEVTQKEEGNKSSDDDTHSSSSSVMASKKLKPKSSDIGATEIQQVKKANSQSLLKSDSTRKTRRSTNQNYASSKSGSETQSRSSHKKPEKPKKQETFNYQAKSKKQERKSAACGGPIIAQPEKTLEENKENVAATEVEEITLAEAQ